MAFSKGYYNMLHVADIKRYHKVLRIIKKHYCFKKVHKKTKTEEYTVRHFVNVAICKGDLSLKQASKIKWPNDERKPK